ncbi:hypothetical protein GCM10009347_38670 [Shewanella algicola]|uniref:Uncharacterized protein n=1 Tax=Shewanella algicola TaxID=640633 RepID=A0A9X1Z843_9GAMM|nr:hypothetical protein [Shewanella algicola]MCL1107508.1 hypothetical protein [Shewanella algicola]GGP69739.1 hypothetical protein GCM10009347_38670 [Shewanella algicola]
MRKSNSKSQAQPFWSNPETIHHLLDKDIVDSMRRGNEKCSAMMMMDPHFEHKTNQYHIQWSQDDVDTLINGMLIRSLEILRNAKPDNDLFKEEIMWQSTPQFAQVCRYAGYNPVIIREEVRHIMKKYGKTVEVDQLEEFVHWSNFFGELFKEKKGVKVVKQSLMKVLVKHAEDDYELITILKQIGELMDDLYLAGVTSRDVMNQYLANAINS